MTDPLQAARASVVRPSFSLQVQVEKFGGAAKENPEMFLRTIESARAFYTLSDEQTLAYVALNLKGKALEWFSNLDPSNWAGFKTAMIERFGTDPSRMLSALTKRVQGEKESVRDYADGLRTLVRYSREVHLQATLRHFFIVGLRPDVQYFVKSRRPATFEDAVAEGEYYEENISGSAAGTSTVASQNERKTDSTNPFAAPAATRRALQDSKRNHALDSLTRQMERLTIKLHEMDRRLAGRPASQPRQDAAGRHSAVNFMGCKTVEDYEATTDDEEDPEIYCVDYCNVRQAHSWRGRQLKQLQPACKFWWPAPNLTQAAGGMDPVTPSVGSPDTKQQPDAKLLPLYKEAAAEAHVSICNGTHRAKETPTNMFESQPEPFPMDNYPTDGENHDATHQRTTGKPSAACVGVKEGCVLPDELEIDAKLDGSRNDAVPVPVLCSSNAQALPPVQGQDNCTWKRPREWPLPNPKMAAVPASADFRAVASAPKRRMIKRQMTDLRSYLAFGNKKLMHHPAALLQPPPTGKWQHPRWAGVQQKRRNDCDAIKEPETKVPGDANGWAPDETDTAF